MTFPDDSFIYLVEDAIITELTRVLGSGGEAYEAPEWLQVRSVQRTGGRPFPQLNDSDLPAIFLEYIAGGEEGRLIGSGNMPGFGEEIWNIFAIMHLTPDVMGIGDDLEQYRDWCVASADTLMRRMVLALDQFDPDVVDPLLSLATNGQRVTTWAMAGTAGTADRDIRYQIALRYRLTTEA